MVELFLILGMIFIFGAVVIVATGVINKVGWGAPFSLLLVLSFICGIMAGYLDGSGSIYKYPLKVKDYKMRTEIRTETLNDSIIKRDTIYVFYLTKLNTKDK